MPGPYRVWDAPTRLFHWSLAALVAFSWASAQAGWTAWHMRSGYAVLALLLFRLAWGLAGSETARLAPLLRPPRAVLAHVREALSGRGSPGVGHTAAGGWMVAAMLGVLAVQAVSGLFVDDEIANQGPLSARAGESFVRLMNRIHDANEWVIAALAATHVAAIAWYRVRLGRDLVGPMLDGRTDDPAAGRLRFAPAWLAALLFAAACGFVYWLVEILPRSLLA